MKTLTAKVLLILILVGQFILTPAMGMPSALLSMLHDGSQQMSEMASMPEMDMPATQSDMASMMNHKGAPCSMVGHNDGLLSKLDCQSLCDIVGGGHCAAYNASVPVIVELPSLDVVTFAPSETISLSTWSVKTAEPTSLSQPPIS